MKEPEEVMARKANIFWPQIVIDFYECRVEWTTPEANFQIPTTESTNIKVDNEPEKVLCANIPDRYK